LVYFVPTKLTIIIHAFKVVSSIPFSTTTSQGITKVGAMSGPWPECLGMEAFNCLNFIRSFTDDEKGIPTIKIEIIHPGDGVTRDFRTDRVRIYCDDDGFVKEIPSRG
jgi:hypothetical protein